MNWLEKRGFSENPFYLNPIPADEKIIKHGFINRKRELKFIKDVVELKKAKILLMGRTGEGKSSLLNVFEHYAKQGNKIIFRVDMNNASSSEQFIENLLRDIKFKISEISEKSQKEIDIKLDELNVIRIKKTKAIKDNAEIEGKIGALIASIKGKIASEESKGEEIEYYIAPRFKKLRGIFEEFLPILFESFEAVLICDNSEKLSQNDFKQMIADVIEVLPENLLFITTADISETEKSVLKKFYDTFGIVFMIEDIDEVDELELFVDGRIKAYSINGVPKISFEKKAIATLLNRTRGNLRESFRYCFSAIRIFEGNITEERMNKAIMECDRPKFEILDELDQQILSFLSSVDEGNFDQIKKNVGVPKDSTLRNRIKLLVKNSLILEHKTKVRQPYRVLYRVPNVVREYFS